MQTHTLDMIYCYGQILRMGGDQRREKAESFAKPEKCIATPGHATFSIGWYNQGHGVRNPIHSEGAP